MKAQGGHSVKNYNQPSREQSQKLNEASRRENMQVVPEGGSMYGLDMRLIQDGNATIEHNVPVEHFYEDVVSLSTQSKTNYTPTLVVSSAGWPAIPIGARTWTSRSSPCSRATSRPTCSPPRRCVGRKRRRSDFVDDDNGREAKKLAERGVLVSIGAHGQQAGLGPHWELWSFVRGGMRPVEALRAGTIAAASSLGYARDIGSLEAGKLADLVVLDADPTVDIRNSEKVLRVMLGGRLYDSVTMNEMVTGTRVRPPYWWEASGGGG